ncbi:MULTISPECIES: ParB N-terminal domain-containing protein [unclassified Streptomyces]|uniref:ParB/RepB/Spo0J family partition protein n=1 Tax=unclassified Streptomyces TaxID=2593676 RepID=UPI003321779F
MTAALAGNLDQETESIPIASLVPGYSPRLLGADPEHVARLTEIDDSLPPILVERSTMRVIDGMHRVMAAKAKGHTTIEVRLFDGATEEAFLLAVRSNMTHGLPLSRQDRRAAARRILVQWPHLSDRAVAGIAGIGAKTVAALRSVPAPAAPDPQTRRGRDGRVRPLDGSAGRRRAAELLAQRPQASLREVARHAGISPATAGDVRRRLASGRSPVLERNTPWDPPAAGIVSGTTPRSDPAAGAESVVHPIRPPEDAPIVKLVRDPSLRHKESGRRLLRLLQRGSVERAALLATAGTVPPHCTDLVAELAREYADLWAEFAREVARTDD